MEEDVVAAAPGKMDLDAPPRAREISLPLIGFAIGKLKAGGAGRVTASPMARGHNYIHLRSGYSKP
jgi:hypothetical protein